MSLNEAKEAAETQLVADGPQPHEGCQYFKAPDLPGVRFMVVEGEIARVDVLKPVVSTISGIRVGDTESEVLEEYGDQVETDPAEVNPSHDNLTFIPSDSSDRTRIVFVSDGSKVTAIQAGRSAGG